MPSWDPQVYGRYAGERGRPFTDLLARVGAVTPQTVVDLGCGSGELTAALARRWPDARVHGIDSSAAMLQRAAEHGGAKPTFDQQDVTTWQPAHPVDVIVSNAVLQWVPDHLPVLEGWARQLAPGGWLAVQVPANFDAPSHALMREVAGLPPFADALDGVLRGSESVADPTTYAALLAGVGLDVDAWETTYLHVLPGEDAVLEWVRGTGLRPVLDALAGDPGLSRAFVDEYAARLRAAYPRRPFGTLLPFRRVFVVATRPTEETA
ncbi:MAG TPA: trans-aconitate 2-methyltransferase [Actinomycetales bacterium]